MRYYLIAMLILCLDQISKWVIVEQLEIGEKITVIDKVLAITSHRNQGAAWGMLQNQFWLFYLITGIVVVGIVFCMQKYAKNHRLLGVSLAFMLGGAIGNFLDRVFRQEVVDFVQVYIGSYPFPIFNVADMALCIAVGLMIIDTLIEDKEKKEAQRK